MGLSTTYTKVETDYKLQELQKFIASGIKGTLKITDTAPTTQGLYILSDVGTYTNLGGLVTTTGKVNYAYFDGTTWKLISIEISNNVIDNLTSTSTTEALSVNMGRVLNEKLKLLEVWEKTTEYTEQEGFYFNDGYLNLVEDSGWLVRTINYKGDSYRITGESNSPVVDVVLYKNSSGVVIGREGTFSSGGKIKNLILTIPEGTSQICLSSPNDESLFLVEKKQLVENSFIQTKKLQGKKIWWCGTSIPETGYPNIVGDMLGATVFNVALGSSPCRAGLPDYEGRNPATDPYIWKGMPWIACVRSLTQTLAEKQWMIDNWETIKLDLFGTTEPLSEFFKNDAINASYENKLLPYLGNNRCDLYVFDHGYNDVYASKESTEKFQSVPTNSRDRNTFIGSVNFLIDLILKDNPRAKILFIGHYSDDNYLPENNIVTKAQENLANYWNFPIIKLWEETGWSMKTVETTGYWTNETEFWQKTWINSGGGLTTKSLIEIWLADAIHPHSLPAKQHLADIIYKNIKI